MRRKAFFIGMLALCFTFSLVLIGCGEEDNPFGNWSAVVNNRGDVATDWERGQSVIRMYTKGDRKGQWYFDEIAMMGFGGIFISGTYTYSGTTAKLVVGRDYEYAKKGEVLTATLSGEKLRKMTITSSISFLNGTYIRQ